MNEENPVGVESGVEVVHDPVKVTPAIIQRSTEASSSTFDIDFSHTEHQYEQVTQGSGGNEDIDLESANFETRIHTLNPRRAPVFVVRRKAKSFMRCLQKTGRLILLALYHVFTTLIMVLYFWLII